MNDEKISVVNKKDRLTCWSHRDSYWKCLDEKNSESDCQEFRTLFEKFCPGQWVKHFDKKRNYLIFKEQMKQEGYVPPFPMKTEG